MADFWVVRTNLGAGLLVATSTRLALAARGAPCERNEDEYWVTDSDATENMTQDLSNLENYTPAPPRYEVESADGVFLQQNMGAHDSWWIKITAPSNEQRVS